MKHKILTMALAIAAIVGLPAMAQNNNTNGQNAEQCCKGSGCQCCQQGGPFAGIQLTAEQQEALKAIQPVPAECGPRMDCPEGPEGPGAPGQCAPGPRPEQCDSAAVRRDPRQDRREYLDKVKAVLTADQYVVFLENIAMENGKPQPRPMMRHDNGKAMHRCAQMDSIKSNQPMAAPQMHKMKGKKK
jgi:hypothetical protein